MMLQARLSKLSICKVLTGPPGPGCLLRGDFFGRISGFVDVMQSTKGSDSALLPCIGVQCCASHAINALQAPESTLLANGCRCCMGIYCSRLTRPPAAQSPLQMLLLCLWLCGKPPWLS